MKTLRNKISIKIELIVVSIIFIVLFILTVSLSSSFIYQKHTKDTIKLHTEEVNRQIVYNYENSLNQIINISNLIASEFEQVDLNDPIILNSLNNIIKINPNILQIALYNFLEVEIVKTGNIESNDNSWFNEAYNDSTIHYFSKPQTNQNKTFLTVSKRLNNDHINGYILKIDYSFESFSSLANKTNLGYLGHITIFDDDYNLIYNSSSNDYLNEEDFLRDLIIGSSIITYEDQPMILNIDTLLHTKWRIAVFTNISDVIEIQNEFITTITILSIIFMTISTIVYFVFSSHITNPLKILERHMATTIKDSYLDKKPISMNGNLEIISLANSYNQMISDIEAMMEEIDERYQAQIKSELRALQNQINPHFLYNTLDSIIWLVENNKNNQASEMINALATLFRISISQGENLITVEKEIEHALSYLKIQSIRYVNSFEYIINVDPEVKHLKTMKLILQPFIENAIYHGLKHNIDFGLIKIDVYKEDDNLVYSIEDNGYGMKDELVEELNKSLESKEISFGIGIKNVYERLKVYYGRKANVIINSELDFGTKIIIIVPIGGEVND